MANKYKNGACYVCGGYTTKTLYCEKCRTEKEREADRLRKRADYKQHPERYNKRKIKKNNLRRRLNHYTRKNTDVSYVIRRRLSSRLLRAVKKQFTNKAYKTIEIIGCDFDTLKKHLESKFTRGMTWEKLLCGFIDIDHIIPCAKFDLSDPEQQKQCFHYTNLQPLWKKENQFKGDKIIAGKNQLKLPLSNLPLRGQGKSGYAVNLINKT